MTIRAVVPWLLVLATVCGFVSQPAHVCAQLPTPNPLIVPPPAPPPPAQLAPIAVPVGVPSLAAVPTAAPAATPVSAGRIFNCSCSGSPGPTHWMGTVSAPSYFAARQSAVTTCLAYNVNKEPQPPVVATGSSPTSGALPGAPGTAGSLGAVTGLIANQAAVASALSAGQQLPSTVILLSPQQLRACAHCACD